MKKFLRNKHDGEVFYYDERLAKHPKLELVTEQEAFPERFAASSVLARKGKSKISLAVPKEAQEAPPNTPPELAADAARGFGSGVSIIQTKFAGLVEKL